YSIYSHHPANQSAPLPRADTLVNAACGRDDGTTQVNPRDNLSSIQCVRRPQARRLVPSLSKIITFSWFDGRSKIS
ncbi:hypothetical protein, partial [Escherichia coli]|uniref:hypothetical protein n=1 Tax=Escherichia coli TaxID=562 RepID=UPI0039E15DCC